MEGGEPAWRGLIVASSSTMANGEFVAYLPQASGYGIILGGGFAFAFFMLILSWLQSKFTDNSPFESKQDILLPILPLTRCSSAEEFSSASRSVKPGLVCSDIVRDLRPRHGVIACCLPIRNLWWMVVWSLRNVRK